MPKLVGVRERRHQPYWDSIIRVETGGLPTPAPGRNMRLFNGTNLSQVEWTNMPIASSFASDNTYIVLALRCWSWFRGTNAQANYQLTAHQLYLRLDIGDKPQFQAPSWYFPAGGGVAGFDPAVLNLNNGVPSQEATLKLAKPIPIPARQHFNVIAEFIDTGATSLLTNLQGQDGDREIKVFVDGIHTRDVL